MKPTKPSASATEHSEELDRLLLVPLDGSSLAAEALPAGAAIAHRIRAGFDDMLNLTTLHGEASRVLHPCRGWRGDMLCKVTVRDLSDLAALAWADQMVGSHRLGMEAGDLEAQPPIIRLAVPRGAEQGSDSLTPVTRA